jgi:hypothetical protein
MRAVRNEVGWEMLNEQQRKFAEEWVRTHNYTKALEFAGYTVDKNNSGSVGNRLVKRCHRYIKYLEAYALREAHVSISAVQHEYVRLGFANPLNYYVRDPVTRKLRPKTMQELTYDEAAAIKEWSWLPIKNDDGTETLVLTDIKLHDKRGPLQDLAKTLGYMTNKPGDTPAPTSGTPTSGIDFSRLPPADLAQLDGLFKKAIRAMGAARDSQAITVPGADVVPVTRGTSGPASSRDTSGSAPRLPSTTKESK